MSIEPITRLQRFLRVLADSSADMPEPLRNLEKCCCYACGHLDTRPELHTTLEKLIASVRDKSIVPPKPNTRLEKYVAAMAGVWDDELPEPITREDKILFEAASGEDVTLSGNPLILENCIGGKALKALHVYGKSTQDGTPTPDAPMPIVSAGDGGSVAVKVTGKNLLQGVRRVLSPSEVIEGGVKIVNSTGGNSRLAFFTAELKKGVQYTISYKEKLVQGADIRVAVYLPDIRQFVTKTFIPKQDTNTLGIYLNPDEIGTVEVTDIQLELGTTATAYSPRREQLLTLPTPNGLPGIPVTSGGNYTDQNGQQWLCDEVDLEREVKVQRIERKEVKKESTYGQISSMNQWDLVGLDKVQPFRLNTIQLIPKSTVICTALPGIVNSEAWGKAYECIGGVGTPVASMDFYIANERLGTTTETTKEEALKALRNWLETNSFSFIYALATPIETPLTPAELAAYKALTTYAPDTVVQASDGAGMEVTYKCNVRKAEKTINDLYAELTAELEA